MESIVNFWHGLAEDVTPYYASGEAHFTFGDYNLATLPGQRAS